jgi:membrane associated rhomboid family serine protease
MDWSLVLASQNIPATILHSGSQWGLQVREQDYEPAVRAIHQYRLENRHWHWRQPIPWSETTFHWGVLGWCVLLILVHWLTTQHLPHWRTGADFASSKAAAGEWWRAFTAIWLHADLGHLLANTTIGLILFGLAMARYSAGVALLATFLAGAAGNLAGLMLYPKAYIGVGASGMVMGALGIISVPALGYHWSHRFVRKHLVKAVFAGVLLFVLMGMNPASDVIAHAGGFGVGALLGVILNLAPEAFERSRRRWNRVAWALFVGLAVWTAWLATLAANLKAYASP